MASVTSSANKRFTRSRGVALGVIMVIALAAGLYLNGIGFLNTGTNSNSTCSGDARVTINGTNYCVDNATKDFVVPNPGFSYIKNGSITYRGVEFTTVCPQTTSSCGNNSSPGVTTPPALAVNVVLTFTDGTNETVGGVVGLSNQFTAFSMHTNPRAGVEVLYQDQTYSVVLLTQI